MKLWIRSQDREMLCKAECVELMHDDPEYAKIFINGEFPDLIVGSYEKKRALEVLDEIQNALVGKIIVEAKYPVKQKEEKALKEMVEEKTIIKSTAVDIKPLNQNCVVYQMPEK